MPIKPRNPNNVRSEELNASHKDHTHAHADTTGQTTDDHHAEAHSVASHDDTTATGAELETLTDGSNADGLHAHDHGALAGLGDDDHTQYYLADGTRALAGTPGLDISVDSAGVPRDVYMFGGTVYFTADGTFSKGDYPGLRAVKVQVQGAGGAGGGVSGGSDSGAGGGGGGGYAEVLVLVASLGTSETVTVGVGGTAVSGGNGNGGEDSSFGTHAVATGGEGGQTNRVRGEHGLGTAGDLLLDGGTGGPGIDYGSAFFEQLGGWGGNSHLGGVTTVASAPGTNSSLAGIEGSSYGGGGSGAASRGSSSPAAAGGDGREGIVIVELYF